MHGTAAAADRHVDALPRAADSVQHQKRDGEEDAEVDVGRNAAEVVAQLEAENPGEGARHDADCAPDSAASPLCIPAMVVK